MGSLFNQTSNTVGSSNTAQNGQQTQTTTPNLPSWLQGNFQNNVAQGQNLTAQASQPVFGQAQQGSYTGAMNSLAGNDISNLNSTLAAHGVTNAAAAGQGAENINLANKGQQSAFLSSVPQLNQQATLANTAAAMNGGLQAAKAVPYGQTTTGTSSGQTANSGTSDTVGNPGLGGILSAITGAAAGGAGGGGGLLGGLGSGIGGLIQTGSWSNPFVTAGNANISDNGTTPLGVINPVLNLPGSPAADPSDPNSRPTILQGTQDGIWGDSNTPPTGQFGENSTGGSMDDMFGQLFPNFGGGF